LYSLELRIMAMTTQNAISQPSALNITDLRIARLGGRLVGPAIIRLDTNQGISGYGEIQLGASPDYALMLKSRIIGENPCNVDRIFRKIKQFGHHGRQGAGVSAIEMALMDLAGKAYGVPCYALAGGRFRDRVLCYCDTPGLADPRAMGGRLRERVEMGYRFLKMDIGIDLLRGIPDTVVAPPQALQTGEVMHPFTGIQITDRGIDHLCEYVAAVRDEVGYEVPLAADHFGHLGLESCIRLGRALDPFCLAWYEDMIPWQFTDQYLRLSRSVDTPICTGEDIFLRDGFVDLLERRAVAVVHPDVAIAGGILETKKIGDLAHDHGVATAIHMGISPIGAMACVHAAAAIEGFLALEIHAVDDLERWSSLVTGLPVPLVRDGHIDVPEAPGLGFTGLDEEVMQHYATGDETVSFAPTDEWDQERPHDRLWS